jgi:hypothetical protein
MASPASLFGEEPAGEAGETGEAGGVLRKARPKEAALKSLPPLTDNASMVEGTLPWSIGGGGTARGRSTAVFVDDRRAAEVGTAVFAVA